MPAFGRFPLRLPRVGCVTDVATALSSSGVISNKLLLLLPVLNLYGASLPDVSLPRTIESELSIYIQHAFNLDIRLV